MSEVKGNTKAGRILHIRLASGLKQFANPVSNLHYFLLKYRMQVTNLVGDFYYFQEEKQNIQSVFAKTKSIYQLGC